MLQNVTLAAEDKTNNIMLTGQSTDSEITCGHIKNLKIRGQPYTYSGEKSKATGLPQGLGVLSGLEDLIIGEITPKITRFGSSIHIRKLEGTIAVFYKSETPRPGATTFYIGSVYYPDGRVETGVFEGLSLLVEIQPQ